MNDTKHTPGPWARDLLSNSRGWVVRSGEPEFGPIVCTVNGKFSAAGNPGQANSCLIAAAPELLAELERMVGHFGAWAADHSTDATTETWAALHCAKAVIAKASPQSLATEER